MFRFIAKVLSPYELDAESINTKKYSVQISKDGEFTTVEIESYEFIYNPVSLVKTMLGYNTNAYADITVVSYGNTDRSEKYTEEQHKAYSLFCKLYAVHAGESWESLITFFNSHYPDVGREELTQYTSERVRREVAGLE